MFIRKRRLMKEIDAMIVDIEYYKQRWSQFDSDDARCRVRCLDFGIGELEELKYWLTYKEYSKPRVSVNDRWIEWKMK